MTSRDTWLTYFVLELENESHRLELHSVDFTIDYEDHAATCGYYTESEAHNPTKTFLDIYRLADKGDAWSVMLFRETWKNWNNGICDNCNIEMQGDYKKFKGWLAMFKLQNMDMNIKWNAHDWDDDEER